MTSDKLNFTVGKAPALDPDRVVCDRCGAIGPIERMAEISVTDGTPEKAMGGGVVAVQHYCHACFGKMLGFGTASPSP
jgi:hypothetical protein